LSSSRRRRRDAGIKKGIIELADLVVINKADGDNKRELWRHRAEMQRELHFLQRRRRAGARRRWRVRR
jgi:putative protein kinase ArgK-like GTPase of G3E family